MNNEQLFSQFSDIEALQAEKAKILKIFEEIQQGIVKLSDIGIKIDASKSVSQTTGALKEYETIIAKVNAAQKKLEETNKALLEQQARSNQVVRNTGFKEMSGDIQKNVEQNEALRQKLKEVQADLKKLRDANVGGDTGAQTLTEQLGRLGAEEANLKIQIEQNTRFIKNQTREFLAQGGSLDEMRAKLNQMIQSYDALSETQKQTAGGQATLKSIQDITAELKTQEQSQGRFFRTVGDYANSLAPLFEGVSTQIAKLKEQQTGLQTFKATNPIGFKQSGGEGDLGNVTAQLQQLERVQQIGFKTGQSYTQQVNTMTTALNDMATEGKQDIQFVTQLKDALSGVLQQTKTATPFSNAFNVLKQSLDEVRQKLKDPALSGAQLKQLEQEEQLLSQLTLNLSKTFTSSRQELRAFTEASVQMGVAMGVTDESVIAFQEAVGEGANEVQDLKSVIKFQASDTKFLTGAVAAVNGLAGAYGAATGAAALFGDDSEQLQKTMIKLQAVLAIVNGLQAVQNALQVESGAVQLALAAKVAVLNAAKKVEATLFAQTALAAEAEAAAMTENAVATEAAAVGQTANAETAVVATEAMEAETAATVQATVATSAFRTVLLASGIIGAIAAIAAGVIFLVSKINDWVGADTKKLEQERALTEALKGSNDAIVEQANLIDKADRSVRNALQNQLDLQTAGGTTQEQQFVLRKKIADEDKRLAIQQRDNLGATNSQQAQLLTTVENYTNKKRVLNDTLVASGAKMDSREKEATKQLLDDYDKKIQAAQNLYSAGADARQRVYDATKQLDQLEVEETKFSADERRKLLVESARLEADLTQTKNNAVLGSDRSSLAQRLAALKSNLNAQKTILDAEKNDTLNNPQASAADRVIAIKKAAEEEQKISIDTGEQIRKLREEYYLRDAGARKTILEEELQYEIEVNKTLSTDLNLNLRQRLQAYNRYVEDEKALLKSEYEFRLQQAGFSNKEIDQLEKTGQYTIANKKVTDEELLAIQKGYENGILKLGVDTQLQLTGIMKGEIDKRKALLDGETETLKVIYDKLNTGTTKQYAEDVIALNNSLVTRNVSYAQYLVKRRGLDEKYQAETAAAHIKQLQESLKLYTEAESQEAQSQMRLQNLRAELAQTTDPAEQARLSQLEVLAEDEYKIAKDTADKKRALDLDLANSRIAIDKMATDEIIANRQKLQDMEQEFAGKIADLFKTVVEGSYDSQNEKIKEQIDLNDKLKDHDIARINESTDAEEVKQARIKIVELRTQDQRDTLEKRQAENNKKKATFDRAFQAFQIIINGIQEIAKIKATLAQITAEAVANPLLVPLIPIVAAQIPITVGLTAASLAAVLATPLPKYAAGTDYSAAGYALVGERGRELGIDATGRLTMYARPTLTYLMEGTKILPNRVTEDVLAANTGVTALATQPQAAEGGGLYAGLLEDAVTELKMLNKKSKIIINNHAGIESTAWYIHQFKQ